MKTLAALKADLDAADTAFGDTCRPHYADGRWGAYRAVECGQDIPRAVEAALNAYHAATHAFYVARDGDRGFLGARGA